MPHDPDCIFCKIATGRIPCHKLYEDDWTLAFLDVGPLSHGHSLVIPKSHYATADQLPADVAGACGQTVAKISQALVQALGVKDYNVLQNNGAAAGQEVHHVHYHIIPRQEGDGLGYRWNAGKLAADQAAGLREQICSQL